MRFGYREECLRHETGPRHPETGDRIRAVRRRLSREHGVEYVAADPATRAELERVHDPDYVDSVEAFCASGGGEWDADTVAVEATWEAARASAGLARWTARAALGGADGRETPFSIGRPPGHHAVVDDAMGFCFFNNAAVAAADALVDGAADRVAVFDWDVHHGNGTQDIFYDRGDVFYASVHERGLFPGTGTADETGEGEGAGTTLNVPYPGGSGDAAYLAAIDGALAPLLSEYDPDLLVVSAGFDAHHHDPISRMRVTTEGYGALADRLRTLAADLDAALGFVLEGGYSLDALADSVAMVNDVFGGREPAVDDGDPAEDALAVLEQARAAHGLT